MLRPRAFNIIDQIQNLVQSGTQFSPISTMNQIERQRESITGGASRQPISALNPQGDRRVTQYPGDPVMPKMSTMPAGSPMRESMYLQPEQPTQPGVDEASLYASAMQENPVQEVPATSTEEPSLYDKTLGDEEWRLRKALALNSMRLNPDAGFAAAVNSRLENLQATRLASSQRNKTADALEQYDAELARAVRNG